VSAGPLRGDRLEAAEPQYGVEPDATSMKGLLEYLARGLVDQPDRVRVDEVHEEDAVVLELSVADDDYGNVIGRGGRTASALRAVIKSAGAKRNRRVFVDIVDS
jgi:uncharacterized protein